MYLSTDGNITIKCEIPVLLPGNFQTYETRVNGLYYKIQIVFALEQLYDNTMIIK